MKSGEKSTGEILDQSLGLFDNPSREQIESAREHVWKRLESEAGMSITEEMSEPNPVRRAWKLRQPAVAAVAASILLVFLLLAGVFRDGASRGRVPAVLETGNGAVKIDYGEIVRSGSTGSVLVLADGSRVEMRSESELALEAAEDGIRIRLDRGSVIVTAVEQRGAHLYVRTKDVTVSVAGTVFFVAAEEAGSRVAVIQGEVRVQESGRLKTLLPGEQVATVALREASPLASEISWSRYAAAHMALLQQSGVRVPSDRAEFEAASVRVNTSGSTAAQLRDSAERVTISNATLMAIIRYAYKDYKTRFTGPDLLEAQRYDIVAKAPSGTPNDQLMPMLQTLLMDRFKMRFHRETIEMPIYTLVISDGGPKLKEMKPGEPISGRGGAGSQSDGLASMLFMGDLGTFAASLSRSLDRPVVDKTGLSGRFVISLTYLPDRSVGVEGASGPSIFAALEEQLGLKLERQRGPIEMIVIDHLEEPTPN